MSLDLWTELELDRPYIIDGLPGTGLVGKIAVEHLIQELELDLVGKVSAEDIPPVMIFHEEDYQLKPSIRIYGAEDSDVVVLNSDIAVPSTSRGFVESIISWAQEIDAVPVHVIGMPTGPSSRPDIFGVSSNGSELLQEAGIPSPPTIGAVAGPAGALMREAAERDVESLGILVETDPFLPDPKASQVAIDEGLGPLTGVEIDTELLVETGDEIRRQKERLAEEIRRAEQQRTTEAYPEDMYR